MAQVSIRQDPRGWFVHQTYTLGAYRLFAGVPMEIDDPEVVAHAKQVATLLVDEKPSVAPEPVAPVATVEASKSDAAVSTKDAPTTKEKK